MDVKLRDLLIEKIKNKNAPNSYLFWGESSEASKIKTIIDISWFMISPLKKSEADFKRLAAESKYPDFIKIEAEQKGSIKVDEINELNNIICYPPFESAARVIFISQADLMTIQAQNALLKKLEEPPQNNFFILSVKKKNSLLPTICSRTVPVFHFEINHADRADIFNMLLSFFPFLLEIKADYGESFIKEQINISSSIAELLKDLTAYNISLAEELFLKDIDTFASNEKDVNFAKNKLIKIRLALTAFFLREIYPESSAKIIKFLENKQFFSIDSIVFFNIKNIISNLKR